jgi:acetoin utilization protein AcuB
MEAPAPAFLTAGDVMTPAPVVIGPDASLIDAAHLLGTYQIRHLPVVDEGGALVGMLSDRDIRDHAGDPAELARAWRTDPLTVMRVADAMARVPITVHVDMPLMALALELADRRVGALPVLGSDGRIVGIVSYVDVLRALAR